jgi:hypothetical protein
MAKQKPKKPKGRSRMINPEGGVRRATDVHKSPKDYRRRPKHRKEKGAGQDENPV